MILLQCPFKEVDPKEMTGDWILPQTKNETLGWMVCGCKVHSQRGTTVIFATMGEGHKYLSHI